MSEDVATTDRDELHVHVEQKYHFFRNESEISNESKVYHSVVPYGNTAHAYDLLKNHVAYPQGGYLRGQVILPGSFLDAMDAHLNISLIYGLEDMKDINEWSITPCLLYVKGDTY